MRTLTDDQIANELLTGHEGPLIEEAARRLRERDFQHLQTVNEMAAAVEASPLVDDKTTRAVEDIITAIPRSRKGFSRVGGLADRILRGAVYDDADVRELAAYAVSNTTEACDAATPIRPEA